MEANKNSPVKTFKSSRADFVKHLWEQGWVYIKTLVDVDIERDSILILDKNLRVVSANESFYKIFNVEEKDTEDNFIYNLGNGQWNIPELLKLLGDIIPGNTFFKGFEVAHDFPSIGNRVMILNARQIYFKDYPELEIVSPIIFLAIEDITEMMFVAETLATHTKQLEVNIIKQKKKLEVHIEKLEKEIKKLKNKP